MVLTIGWLLLAAGFAVKRATGKSIFRQATEMWHLWFADTIDPPSYYALELYRTKNMLKSKGYLTRYETKNGLFKALNTVRPQPWDRNEMNDKSLFSKCCTEMGLPHALTIAEVSKAGVEWKISPETIDFDLFCKRQKGMGAKGCSTFRFVQGNVFQDKEGSMIGLPEIVARLSQARDGKSILVQRWLKNHGELADLAKDSLLTIRVITCMNEFDRPEVCWSMLRLLVVLEPDWQHLPDGEYAAPIDLGSGKIGGLTGDSMKMSPFRYDSHPITGAIVKGRRVPDWNCICKLAIRAQSAFRHRLTVGWDIALTPNGPVLLEGNTNFDVMFMQRVHDAPLAESRFGPILQYHLERMSRSFPV